MRKLLLISTQASGLSIAAPVALFESSPGRNPAANSPWGHFLTAHILVIP